MAVSFQNGRLLDAFIGFIVSKAISSFKMILTDFD